MKRSSRASQTEVVIENLKRMLTDRHYTIESAVRTTIHYVCKNVDADPDHVGVSGPIQIVAIASDVERKQRICCILHDREQSVEKERRENKEKEKDTKRSFGIDSVRKYLPFLKENQYTNAIFLVDAKVTPQAQTAANRSKIVCEFFVFDTLTYILVDHWQVPKFSRVPVEKIAALMEDLKIESIQQLPKMTTKDPIAKYYGYRLGEVIKVEGMRKVFSQGAGSLSHTFQFALNKMSTDIPTTFNLQCFGFVNVGMASKRRRQAPKTLLCKGPQSSPQTSSAPLLDPSASTSSVSSISKPLSPPPPKRSTKLPKRIEIRSKDQLTARQHDLYRRLYYFYNGTNYIVEYLLPLRTKNTKKPAEPESSPHLSLRTVNYLVTTYAHLHPIRYVVDGCSIDMASSYDNELLQHTKKLFDPFRRHWRIWWELPSGEKILTTLAQLNFFRWAIKYKVFQWAEEHRLEIEKHMKQHTTPVGVKKSRSSSPSLQESSHPCDTSLDT